MRIWKIEVNNKPENWSLNTICINENLRLEKVELA